MTARRFGAKDDEKASRKNLKTLGGAVAGAVAFNFVENKFSGWKEEFEEHEEKKEEPAEAQRS